MNKKGVPVFQDSIAIEVNIRMLEIVVAHVCLRDSQWRHLDSISSKGPLIDVIATEQCVSVERIGNKCCNLHSGVVALFSKIE